MRAKPFSLLAQVYDSIMSDVDYEDWGLFIIEQLKQRGWQKGKALDLGCGTGNSTFPLFALGVKVVGLDASNDMLKEAREKLPPVRFVEADFRNFELNESFGLVYSVFDALNNLLTPEAFLEMAQQVYKHLEPGGFFMFDANTREGLEHLWESSRAEGWIGGVYYRWDHSFDRETGLAKVEAYCEKEGQAFTEVHYERPYDGHELKSLLTQAGFTAIEIISYPEAEPAPADEPRIWVIAQKPSDSLRN
ncbi:MAG: methyltransferase domain-containing protein [Trueperaceae bacterium]|nr:methyltransferase domain-containing protein [Trueperaceae bacterium]